MNGKNLPPQAYPRETLSKAYEWLNQQSPTTRELATDMETLVSLYLQSEKLKVRRKQKKEDSHLFQQELKSLAEGVKTFNGDPQTPLVSNNEVTPQQQMPLAPTAHSIQSNLPHQTIPSNSVNSGNKTAFIDPKKYLNEHKQKLNHNQNILSDPKIKNMLQTTQNQLNLSSENEAMKALLSIGFIQIKKLFS